MRIAVEGCAHGELNKIYECIKHIEIKENIKVDLLICCGDFQSVRDRNDLASMAVPDKYMEMKDFHEYYSGKKVAPVLTIFIAGNHEASAYLWELPYGGWVAENIFYLGFAGVINYAGVRIGGISGIFKKHDYLKDHFEIPPFNKDTKRSFYHVRKRDVDKLKLLQDAPPDIILSHDWPTNIYNHGDKEQLIRFKPFLKDEIESSTLGNEGAEELLTHVQPTYWFSGHMHAKFAAMVDHPNGRRTKFLALDKCLPKRKFLQILDLGEAKGEGILKYDPYWLGILKMTNGLTRFQEPTKDHKPNEEILNELSCTDLDILPFSKSVDGENLQTSMFCEKYNLINPCKSQSWKNIKRDVKSKENSVVPPDEKNLESISTPKMKMCLPKPGTGDTMKKINVTSVKSKADEDDFGEIRNPNSSSIHSDRSSSDTNSSDSSSDSSSGSDNDDNTSDDEDVETTKHKKKSYLDFPSFIETPLPSKSPIVNAAPSDATPLKMKTDKEKLQNKALSFLDTPSDEKSTGESSIVESATLTKNSFLTSTNSCNENHLADNVSGKVDEEVGITPIKKFKLIRRNQSIYTPTKESE